MLARAQELGLSAHHSEDGLDRLVSLLANLAGTPFAAFWIIEGGQQFLASAHGNIARTLPAEARFGRRVIESETALDVADARLDPDLKADPLVVGAPGLRFLAGTPIRDRGGKPIGALCMMDTETGRFDESRQAALAALAGLLEDRLRLRADVLHDPQTGVLTRRQFDDVADREWRRAMRSMVPLSLILARLDRHPETAADANPALDRGIRAAALAMQYSVHRPGDCVGRLDQNRFATLLYGTDAANTRRIAERVRQAVEALQIPLAGEPATMTLSQGMATVPPNLLTRCDMGQLIDAADNALARAMSAGGNRFEVTTLRMASSVTTAES